MNRLNRYSTPAQNFRRAIVHNGSAHEPVDQIVATPPDPLQTVPP